MTTHEIDTSCCLRIRRRVCTAPAMWIVTNHSEAIAFTCQDHLSQTLALLYRRNRKDEFALRVEPLESPVAVQGGSLRVVERGIAFMLWRRKFEY